MKFRIPINTITVIALCIASSKIQVLSSAFIYDRSAIWRGEIWRLVTSHFVHFNAIHLIYNLIAFGIVGWIIESKGYKHFKLLYFMTACSISAVLLAVKPGMVYFGGLSGVACGFFVYCALYAFMNTLPGAPFRYCPSYLFLQKWAASCTVMDRFCLTGDLRILFRYRSVTLPEASAL